MNLPLETKQIMEILPHRYPFLLVDRIVECNDVDHIVGIKNVTANEPCFTGHFPGEPIFPGVLQLEAMAQVSGVLLNLTQGSAGSISYYLGVDNARFRRIVRPGDQLRIEAQILKVRLGTCRVHGTMTVNGEITCEADMLFGGGGK